MKEHLSRNKLLCCQYIIHYSGPLNLQLPNLQSVPITTEVVSSNPAEYC